MTVVLAMRRSIAQFRHVLWQEPFIRLTVHCINRIFSAGESSDPSDIHFGIGAILALLALPGAFVSLFLSDRYSSLLRFMRGEPVHFDVYTASLPDEYFFLVLAMILVGSVVVWKWDSLLPDTRDFVNLAPLPIHSSKIFLANVTALLFLAGIFSIDINAASCVLFPWIACSSTNSASYIAAFFVTHAFSVLLASVFTFLAVLAVMGALMAVLPYRFFRRTSLYVRVALLIFFAALLTTSFSVPRKIAHMPHLARLWLELPPSAWFVGLCQTLRGRADPLLLALAHVAIIASLATPAVAICAYAISYNRCFTRSAQTMVALSARRATLSRYFHLFDKLILRSPFQRAGYHFVLKTLFRSEAHALTLGGFTGLGMILISQTLLANAARPRASSLFPSAELLGLPLVLSYFLLFALRIAFEIPASVRANWLFRLLVDQDTRECTALAGKVMLTFGVPLFLTCFVTYTYFWGWRVGLIHTAFVATLFCLLMETLLVQFRKIPFTCPMPSFKSNAVVSILIWILGFLAFSIFAANAEHAAFARPVPFAVLIVVAFSGWWFSLYLWRRNLGDLERRLAFEEEPMPAVEVLDLTFRR